MIKHLFSTRPETRPDDWDGELPWYNYCYEWNGPDIHNSRIRFLAGDLLAEAEGEYGGSLGPQFGFDLRLCQSDIPEFYCRDRPDAEYDIHYLSIIVWRWGIYLSIRGRLR